MKFATTALLLVASLGLAACNNPDKYATGAGGYGAGGAGGVGGAGGAGGYGADGIGTSGIGDASNPRSIAYFNQTVGDRVLFLVDQSTVSPQARTILDGQARWLATNPEYRITIEGHADEQGTREYNLALGARRANAVQEYLISQGIAPSRMRTVSYGKERPVATCPDESCFAQNRRAVTVLASGAGS